MAGYAIGATDKFQGTGVYSGVKFEREPKDSSTTTASSSLKGDEKKKGTNASTKR